MSLTDKVAMITGATGQLGPAVARGFGIAGAKLALVSTSTDELVALSKGLDFPSSRVFTVTRDLMEEASAQVAVDAVIERYGRVDILLHLVGGYQGGALRGLPNEVWEYMMNLNLRTAMNTMRACVPTLVGNGWGRIITISSGVTEKPPANSAAYVAAKAALEALTLSVAQDVKEHGVTANVLLIRALDTPEERAKQPNKTTGWVKPEEVAAAMLYLCSDEGGAVNAARIPVYG